MSDFDTDYRALTTGIGWADFGDRSQIEMTGEDRAKFLHNLCTNNIKDLPVGHGCEAFLLNAQGKILGHVLVFCGPDSLVLETVPGQGERLTQHLDRYLIREKVELHDRSREWSELLLSGVDVENWLLKQGADVPPPERLVHCATTLFDVRAWLRRVDFAGPQVFLIAGERASVEKLAAGLSAGGVPECGAAAVEALRIEAGFPHFGADITDKNLPQEVARDKAAISFTKGCYIGQETVARIDALGHVNRLLCGVRFDGGDLPAIGAELTANEQAIGHVTSATFSPKLNSPLALAYVRRGHHEPGTKLIASQGTAEVVTLPVK